MPSTEHDVVADLVARQPHLLIALAALAGVRLPRFDTMARADSDLSLITPLELRADKVTVYRAANLKPIFSTIFEIQLRPDVDKPYAWPAYVTSLRVTFRCPVLLFVVTLSASVERKARRGIDLGGGNIFRPIVIGPSLVPKITEATDENWELAILSALMHAKSKEGPDIAAAAILGARDHADEDDQALYFDLISNKLSVIARELLKGKLMDKHYEPLSAFSRHWKRVGVKEGREEGRAEGREAGREEGREAGREEGGRERLVQSVLLVLEARGLKLSAAAQAKLAAIRDLATLTDTVRRAALVESADALFVDAPAPVARKRSKRR